MQPEACSRTPPEDPSSPETPENLAKLQSDILDRLAQSPKQPDSDN